MLILCVANEPMPGVDVWRAGANSHMFACGSRVPQSLAVLVARGRGTDPQPQHPAYSRGLDGQLQRVLLQNQSRYLEE